MGSEKSPDPAVPDRDCGVCGACCVAPQGNKGWAEYHEDEIEKVPDRIARRLRGSTRAESTFYTPYMIPVVKRGEFNLCVFLDGTPGEKTRCSIYADRPKVCREFPFKSTDCSEIRKDYQIEV